MPLPQPTSRSVALVTGASSGIGQELARGLAARGHGLVLVARRQDRLEALSAEMASRHGVRAEVMACDLADSDRRAELANRIADLGLQVDILVNNAGFGLGGPFHRSDPGAQVMQLRVLCEAPVVLLRAFLPGMVERRTGTVINVASTAGMQPLPGSAGYGAAKAHLLSLSEAVHAEVKRFGVTVTALCPGPVFTEFFDRDDHTLQRVPRRLWMRADEVAEAALEGVESGKRVVIPGRSIRAGSALMRLAPRALELRLLERMFH